MGYLSPAPRTPLVRADAWTVLRPSLELLLGRHPCWTQAAGERYPTHLDDASTYAESAGHEEWLYQTTLLFVATPLRLGTSSRVSVSLDVDEELQIASMQLDVSTKNYGLVRQCNWTRRRRTPDGVITSGR